MSLTTYVVNINNQDIIMEVSETSFGTVQISDTNIAQVTVEGGVPGPKGLPGESSEELITLHILDPTPHPPYDDMPLLTIIYENGLI